MQDTHVYGQHSDLLFLLVSEEYAKIIINNLKKDFKENCETFWKSFSCTQSTQFKTFTFRQLE